MTSQKCGYYHNLGEECTDCDQSSPDLDDLRRAIKVRRSRDPREWGRLIVELVDKVHEVAESFLTAEEQYEWLGELRKPHLAVESYGSEFKAVFDAIDENVEIRDDDPQCMYCGKDFPEDQFNSHVQQCGRLHDFGVRPED